MAEIFFDPACTPEDIERRSFEIIDSEIPEPRPYCGQLWEIARRCVHALGDTAIVENLRLDTAALQNGLAALRSRCVIYTDTRMLAAGLVARRMAPLGLCIKPLMELPGIDGEARRLGITRSRCGMKMIAEKMAGSIIAIGNAPTALMALLEELDTGNAKPPALIVGMPVGFVNAAQSKEWLAQTPWPHFTLLGRKGGSAVAAACVNALAEIVARETLKPAEKAD